MYLGCLLAISALILCIQADYGEFIWGSTHVLIADPRVFCFNKFI